MDLVGKPELWRDLFVMIGTSAGALVGLLFVVISLHVDRIAERTDINMRMTVEGARNNTYHLLTVMVEAAIVLTPQPLLLMGLELVAANLFGLRLPLNIVRRYRRQRVTISEQGGFPTRLILTIIAAYAAGAAGGVALAMSQDWGLFLVAGACMVKLVRTVLTAWMLMFGMFHVQPPDGD
ncbi:MAG: hypothetical protein JSR98_18370 [Proteobacteria bacterium]|nr:hypothetical protein [Pseudomonadota bacterium]